MSTNLYRILSKFLSCRYKIEYQHDGKWQFYNHRILGNMSNSMRLPNMASGTYDIWLRSYGVLAYSHMSNTVRVKVVNGRWLEFFYSNIMHVIMLEVTRLLHCYSSFTVFFYIINLQLLVH